MFVLLHKYRISAGFALTVVLKSPLKQRNSDILHIFFPRFSQTVSKLYNLLNFGASGSTAKRRTGSPARRIPLHRDIRMRSCAWEHLAEVPGPGNAGVSTKAHNKQLLKPSDGAWKIHSPEGEMAHLARQGSRLCAGGGKCEVGAWVSGAPAAAGCFLSHQRGMGLLPGRASNWAKGLGTETCGLSYSHRDGRGEDWFWRLHTLIRWEQMGN